MAEIILPPEEETPETPQTPELNIDKPTENSKVITIEFEAKKTNKVSTKDTNQQLYTTDTDAWFEFKETSLEGANGTYSVVFRNRHDGSIFQRTGDVVNGVAYYKIPHQEIRHAGAWRGQVVYTLSNGDTTAREFDYDVKGHILDGKDVREIIVEDFETLMSQLRSMKDNAEVELADLVNTANQNETDRQAFFDDLVEDIDELQANYQELLETGVLQTNINTKLEALEEEYAPKLTEVTTQLAQTANIINVDYGEVELPSDFPALPFSLTAHGEDRIMHGFNIDEYKVGAGEVYLDCTAPPSRDGLTPETSVKHLYQALNIAESMPQSTVIIYVMNKYYSRNYNGVNGTRTLTKNIIFSPYQREKSFIGSFEEPSLLNWEPDGKAFKTTRSATKRILDLAVPYKDTEPYPYKEVSSIAEVQAEEGTFYIQGSDVWVRRFGDKEPDDDLMVMMDIVNPTFSINDKKLIFDRVSWFWFYDATPSDGLKVTGNVNSELVLYKSSFAHAHLNGLATIKIGRVYNVESKAYDNGTDGFNYHGTVPMALDPYELVYEYGTESFDNGSNGLDNNNASTAHEGINILRVNTLTYDTEGPIIADVNGCYSILINCISHSSRRNVSSRLKSAFFFNNTSAVKPGKAILINCGGGGKDTYAVATDVGFDLKVRRFKGANWWSDALNAVEFI